MTPKRVLFIGAHPDDADVLCGATAIKLARAGHKVKFVSATNGDTGHHLLSRAETVVRRKAEAQAAARCAGLAEYEILNHDCGLEPSVGNRRELLRLIRRFSPDLVISHRTCDYHPDHRATAQLVLDTAYVVMVPHFCEETPIPEKIPVYAYSYDRFVEPRPHRADAAIECDSILEEKLTLLACHASQFFEWLPWADGQKNFDASTLSDAARKQHLLRWMERFRNAADNARELLKKVHGPHLGGSLAYAETFEQSTYSRQLPPDDFQRLLMP